MGESLKEVRNCKTLKWKDKIFAKLFITPKRNLWLWYSRIDLLKIESSVLKPQQRLRKKKDRSLKFLEFRSMVNGGAVAQLVIFTEFILTIIDQDLKFTCSKRCICFPDPFVPLHIF